VTAQRENGSKLHRKCGGCGHVKVCSVFRAVAPLLKGWTEETRPFEAEELATICKEFIPTSTISILKSGTLDTM